MNGREYQCEHTAEPDAWLPVNVWSMHLSTWRLEHLEIYSIPTRF